MLRIVPYLCGYNIILDQCSPLKLFNKLSYVMQSDQFIGPSGLHAPAVQTSGAHYYFILKPQNGLSYDFKFLHRLLSNKNLRIPIKIKFLGTPPPPPPRSLQSA